MMGGRSCVRCGRPTRRVPDIIEEVAVDAGRTVKHVHVPTDVAEHRTAARLRFSVADLARQPT
jgi:hypothetical protein